MLQQRYILYKWPICARSLLAFFSYFLTIEFFNLFKAVHKASSSTRPAPSTMGFSTTDQSRGGDHRGEETDGFYSSVWVAMSREYVPEHASGFLSHLCAHLLLLKLHQPLPIKPLEQVLRPII